MECYKNTIHRQLVHGEILMEKVNKLLFTGKGTPIHVDIALEQTVWVPYEILPLCSASLFADIGREEKAFIFINNGMLLTENRFLPISDSIDH